ncbi:MAG: hypothetical protein QOK08_1779 [Actinomycetota bacterium]|nr:hypothetical protein [Actinomycetota bacterium]
MRWDNLFDDLESQLEQELSAEEVDLKAEEERLRLARLGIRDRLYALHLLAAGEGERMLRLTLRDGSRITVTPSTFGRDWFSGELIEESGRRPSCILPIESIDGITLEADQVAQSLDTTRGRESPNSLSARLGLQFVLRDLCRRRQPVELQVPQPQGTGGRIHGTIDRVGRDHLDLAVHEPGRPRRESAVTEYRIVRLSQVLLVRL